MNWHGSLALRGARHAWFAACTMALCAVVSACAAAERPAARYPNQGGPLTVHVAERALIIALRPGDEMLAAAGLAQRVIKRVGTVSTLLLSSGESGSDALAAGPAALERKAAGSGRPRSNEARAASRACGRGLIRLSLLGFPDAQLAAVGCEAELRAALPGASCGGAVKPVALSTPGPHKELRLSAAARAIKASLERALKQMPTLVAFPDPYEGQPDQRAVGLLTVLALRDHMRGRSTPWPRALAYVSRPGAWPRALSRAPRDPDMPPLDPPHLCLPLNEHERARKREALAAYAAGLPTRTSADSECFAENTPEHLDLTARELLGQTLLPPRTARVP